MSSTLVTIGILAQIIASLMVMRHVLLNHREVRSAIGWIGLAWLAPVIGVVLYPLFGINRVSRKARRIIDLPADADPVMMAHNVLGESAKSSIVSIAKTGDAVAGVPLTIGNSTQIYCNGDEAYPAMLAALDSAKNSIAIQSYIFRADVIGTEFASRLISAKNRGVEVRVLVDGVGSGYFSSPIIDILQTGGVTAERFLHEIKPWKMSFINLRNHKKLLVVDGKIGFTGGLNIEDENIGGNHLPRIQDVHFRLEGPIVSQLLMSFALDWKFCTSETLSGERWWPKMKSSGNLIMRGISAGPNESMRIIETIMAAAVEQAQVGIRIVTPYFLPEDSLFEVIRRASLRGVKVEVVMPKKTDHFFFDWAIAAHLATFPSSSLHVYMTPEPFDHSKLMSVDGQWCSFGSSNWDARSSRLNFEFQVECYDQKTVALIDAVIDKKKSRAEVLNPTYFENHSIFVKLRNSSARLLLPYL